MAEGSDTEGWSKIRSRRNEKAQLVRKLALSQAQTLSRVERGGMGFVLTSPTGKFIFEIIWRNIIG